jgi:hypothetical protein
VARIAEENFEIDSFKQVFVRDIVSTRSHHEAGTAFATEYSFKKSGSFSNSSLT